MYFFASAIVIYERSKPDIQYIKSNRSITFTLDHYPSKSEIEEMFNQENVLRIDIMCVQKWCKAQYDGYHKI